MPFTTYTLVGTFLLSLLSLNSQIQINKLSPTLLTTYKTQQLFSEITKSNTPSTPVPYRGGGRRYLVEPFKNIEPLV
ncbi:heterocyst-inhibiting protein PatX [uncultured Nostoc sp.]|uniref:heterocyst-inhibiting protein PatX n=1 Tax=uncultured Nostoc sp. TaxID=340711 RepID=UPI0035CB4CAA